MRLAWHSTTDRRRSLLEKTRRLVGSLFLEGLANVRAKSVEQVKASLSTLGRTDLAASFDGFNLQKDYNTRFKTATKLVLALDELALSLIEPPQIANTNPARLPGCPALTLSPRRLRPDGPDMLRLAKSGHGYFELLNFVRKDLRVYNIGMGALFTLLTNSSISDEVLAALSELENEKKTEMASVLVERKNRMLRRAGAILLTGCSGTAGAEKLVDCLADDYLARFAGPVVWQQGKTYKPYVISALRKAGDRATRLGLARWLRFLEPAKDDQAFLLNLEKDESPEVAAHATIALFRTGYYDLKRLRSNIADVENNTLRIYSKVELYRERGIDKKYIVSEFNGDDKTAHSLVIEALRNCPPDELLMILDPIVHEALYGKNRSLRKECLRKLIALDGPAAEKIFTRAVFDPDPEVADTARRKLIDLWGFSALEMFFDPWKAINNDPALLSLDELHALNYYILPHVPATGDSRFTEYMAHLFLELCSSGHHYDFQQTLRPRLIEFGEPLVDALAENLYVPDNNVSLAAEDLLLQIGGPTAEEALAGFNSGTPPVEVALRQLSNPATADTAREIIIEEGRSTIPVLLEMLGDPKCRGEVLKILVHFSDPDTFPQILKLLGNPSPDMVVAGDISVILRDIGFADREITARLVELGSPIVAPLVEKLSDGNWTVRYHAAMVLGLIGNGRAVPALIRLLQTEEESSEVVRSVIKSLGKLKATQAVGLITPFLDDSNREIRFEAYHALGAIGNPEALRPLEYALQNCKDLGEKRAIQAAMDLLKG